MVGVPFREEIFQRIDELERLSVAQLKELPKEERNAGLGELCYDGNLDAVKRLVAAKADIDSKGYLGETPLYWAITYEHLSVVEFLLSKKAKIKEEHLRVAIKEISPDIVQTLINAGAKVADHIVKFSQQRISDIIEGHQGYYDDQNIAKTYKIFEVLSCKTPLEVLAEMERDKAAIEQKDESVYNKFMTKQQLLDGYNEAIKHYKEEVAITTDGWTSRSTESYVTVTSSHINDDWEMVNFVLQTRCMDESHTGVTLTETEQKQLTSIFAAGTEKDYFVRVNFVGFTGAGKTSIMLQMFLQKFEASEITSTDGIDICLGYCIIDLATGEWKKYNKKENDELLERIKAITMTQNNQASNDEKPEPRNIPLGSAHSDPEQEKKRESGGTGKTFEGTGKQHTEMNVDKDHAGDLTGVEIIYDRQTETQPGLVVDEHLNVRIQQATETSGRNRETAFVNGFDYAGQATYYSLHQLFFSKRGINLVVLDASRDFNDPIDDEDARHIGGHLTGNSKDFFRYWSKLLRYFLPRSRTAKIITVFTHKDLLQDQDQLRNKKCDIQDIIKEMGMEETFYKDIFCVNANDPGDKDLNQLRHIILGLSKTAGDWGQRMPSRWLLLEDKLMTKKSEGIRVMTLTEVEELNEKSSPRLQSREELLLFLKVHHDIGTLIHFADEGLQNVVILDAQWLVDSFKTIISAKKFKDHIHRKEWKRLHKKGIVDKEFIHKVWKGRKNERFFEFRDELILLMNTMDLISSPRKYNDRRQHVSIPYYVVPCMLQKSPRDFISKYQKNAEHKNNALSFEFEHSFLPTATVYRLLATCIMQYGDSDTSQKSKPTVYCNAAVFKVYAHHFLTLEITSSSIIANILVTGKRCVDVGVSQGVKEFLDDTLKCIIDAQKTTTKYEMSVACGNPGKDGTSWIKWKDLMETSSIVCDSHENDSPHVVDRDKIIKQWLVTKIMRTEPQIRKQKIHEKSKFEEKPTHILLGRISRRIPRKDIHLLFIALGLGEVCISVDQHKTDTLLLLFEWLENPSATLQALISALEEQQDFILDIEEVQMLSDEWRTDFPIDILDTKVSDATDADIDTACLMTGARYLELGLELGFIKEAVDAFAKDYRYCHKITRQIITSWIKKQKSLATWKVLGDALYEIRANPEFIMNICNIVRVATKSCAIA